MLVNRIVFGNTLHEHAGDDLSRTLIPLAIGAMLVAF